MGENWFKMVDIRGVSLRYESWIPLRSSKKQAIGADYKSVGFREFFFGLGSLAVPVAQKAEAEDLDWGDIGLRNTHQSYVSEGSYYPADVFFERGHVLGVPLVLVQSFDSVNPAIWHLHQDLVLALHLVREGDNWKCVNEGYADVVKLKRDGDGVPCLVEIKTEFLLDYLCARNMGLYTSAYWERREIIEDASLVNWAQEGDEAEEEDNGRWRGRVFHQHGGENFVAEGGYWRNEWIDPGPSSPRVREDDIPINVPFIVDVYGRNETKETLSGVMGWLHFKPDVVESLLKFRGSGLGWSTRDTGGAGASSEGIVHFGVNALGHITVFAKDVGELPAWQQKIWAAHNVTPEGGVSAELFKLQMQNEVPSTKAPEILFDEVFKDLLKTDLFISHPDHLDILKSIHRFRSLDLESLCGLAKDIARLTADTLNKDFLRKIVGVDEKDQKGSLKLVEKSLVAKGVSKTDAHNIMSPLFVAYDLRLRDAHLPSAEYEDKLRSIGIDISQNYIEQGCNLIETCSSALKFIYDKFVQG